MAVNNAFVDALLQILGNEPQAPVPGGLPATTDAIPQPRPAALPQGTFTPGADTSPLSSIINPPQAPGRSLLRSIGAGAANLRNTGGDPFMSFGQGFGGATGFYDKQEALDAANAAAEEEKAYRRSKDAYGQERDVAKDARQEAKDAADLELRRLAEDRAQKTADLSNQKTALELRRLARSNGLEISQVLEIERIAQAAGENIIEPEERKKEIDATRERLLEQATSGQGISGRQGLTTPEVTATGPNGEKVVLRDGQWVPM